MRDVETILAARERPEAREQALAELKQDDPEEAPELLEANTLKLAKGAGKPRRGAAVHEGGVVREFSPDPSDGADSPQETR